MKQRITNKQWNEITEEQQAKFVFSFAGKVITIGKSNIGEMIEFLGDDFEISKPALSYNKWYVKGFDMEEIRGSVLCDLLWEAVKDKLK